MVEFKLIDDNDLDTFIKLLNNESYLDRYRLDIIRINDLKKDFYNKPNVRLFGVYFNKNIIGIYFDRKEKNYYITGLWLFEGFVDKKLGSEVVPKIYEMIYKPGDILKGWIEHRNTRMTHFIQKFGFKIIKRTPLHVVVEKVI